ncbi:MULTISPECIES: hypothetical protein [unclassified Spirillospora]|uniref:hypothetical protein n=1 Tax=unclassified Spirillospora TaxID=2642701 RepID=UPI003719B46C
MTGRHRGQPGGKAAEDEVDESSSRGKWIGVAAGAVVVPVVLVTLIVFGSREEPPGDLPGTVGTSAQKVAPAPAGEPTYGKYIPPEQEPQAATKAPRRAPAPRATPRRTRRPTSPSPSPSTRRPCPPGWEDVWWMRRWCEQRDDRDGHRGR